MRRSDSAGTFPSSLCSHVYIECLTLAHSRGGTLCCRAVHWCCGPCNNHHLSSVENTRGTLGRSCGFVIASNAKGCVSSRGGGTLAHGFAPRLRLGEVARQRFSAPTKPAAQREARCAGGKVVYRRDASAFGYYLCDGTACGIYARGGRWCRSTAKVAKSGKRSGAWDSISASTWWMLFFFTSGRLM